jgi:phytoene dehydrogenase-like protein
MEIGDNKAIRSVRLKSGEVIEGDCFISTVHPTVSISWFPESTFSKAFKNRMREQKHTDSTFSIYITLKPETFPYINSNLFYACDYNDICAPPVWDIDGPRTLMALTAPSGKEGAFARTLKISAPISFESFRRWEGTLPGQRGSDYEVYKEQCAESLFKRATSLFPHLPEAVESRFAASPLTYQHYSGSVNGSNYGFAKDCRNLQFSRVLPRTKVPNFFFSGQNLNMHGILGVPISAVITCGELIGLKQLLTKIERDR